MKFAEAEATLRELADGRYYSITYEKTVYPQSESYPERAVTQTRLYIDPRIQGVGNTFFEAIINLKAALGNSSTEEDPQVAA